MNIKMLKAALAGLVLSISGFANAGLIAYDYTGSGNGWDITGTITLDENDIVANTNILDKFHSWEFFWTDSVSNGIATSLDSIFGALDVFQVDASFIINNVSLCTNGCVAGNLTDIFVSLNSHNASIPSGAARGTGSWSMARQVDVPEPSTLAIFALGIMGLASRRFKKQA